MPVPPVIRPHLPGGAAPDPEPCPSRWYDFLEKAFAGLRSLFGGEQGHPLIGRISSPFPLKADTDLETVEQYLSHWVQEEEVGENRIAAKAEFLRFLRDETSHELSLNQLGLKSLPNIFNVSAFSTRLKELIAFENALETLPSTIGCLSVLDMIMLHANKLRELPPEIGQLRLLKALDLQNNLLRALPEEVREMRSLEIVYLNSNQIESIPAGIGNWISLQSLYLGDNRLETIPSGIGRCILLKELSLVRNSLIRVPPTVGRLSHLEALNLSHNPAITEIPFEFLTLSARCTIGIEGCGLTPAVLEELRERTSAPGYHGPHISHSIAPLVHFTRSPLKSVEELLRELYQIAERPYQAVKIPGNVVHESELQIWLSRMSLMKDYKATAEGRKLLVDKILTYIEHAGIDLEFQKEFAGIVIGAGESCGDRVSLSVLKLGIAYKLTTINKKNLKELADFLKRGVWALKLLETCAENKIPSLQLFDEVEVYLAYPISLKDRLQLPIDVDEMRYFRCSGLNPEDLDSAAVFVESHLKDEEASIDFLIHNSTWKRALVVKYPTKCAALEREKAAKFRDKNIEEEDLLAAQNAYLTGLKDLIRKTLNS